MRIDAQEIDTVDFRDSDLDLAVAAIVQKEELTGTYFSEGVVSRDLLSGEEEVMFRIGVIPVQHFQFLSTWVVLKILDIIIAHLFTFFIIIAQYFYYYGPEKFAPGSTPSDSHRLIRSELGGVPILDDPLAVAILFLPGYLLLLIVGRTDPARGGNRL